MKQLAMIALLDSFDSCYSLNSVIAEQLASFRNAGYSIRLITLEDFGWTLSGRVDVRACLPSFDLTIYGTGLPPSGEFESQVDSLYKGITDNLADVDVCLTHDLLFQPMFLPHNAAVRKAAHDHGDLRWLHWIHSAPVPRPANLEYPHSLRFTPMEASLFVCPNPAHVPLVAQQYSVPEASVRVVFNVRDTRTFFDMDRLCCEFVESYDLLNADVIAVYPTRLSPAKQPEIAIQIMARIKAQGQSVRLVFCNSYGDTEPQKMAIAWLREIGSEWGLTASELIFTSQYDREWETCVPQKAVREFLQLSNVFLFPSTSESWSLVLMEAALAKTLLVLNEDHAPIREMCGEHALYFKFGADRWRKKYESDTSNLSYINDCAREIIAELRKSKTLGAFSRVRQFYNRDWILKEQLRPLLEESAV